MQLTVFKVNFQNLYGNSRSMDKDQDERNNSCIVIGFPSELLFLYTEHIFSVDLTFLQ